MYAVFSVFSVLTTHEYPEYRLLNVPSIEEYLEHRHPQITRTRSLPNTRHIKRVVLLNAHLLCSEFYPLTVRLFVGDGLLDVNGR